MRDINFKEYKEDVLSSDKLVMIDFYAEWCNPCKRLKPVMEEMKAAYDGTVMFVKVDIEKERELSDLLGVLSIPTVIAMKNGEIVKTKIGKKTIDDYKEIIEEVI